MQENISCKIYSNVHGKMLLLFQLHSWHNGICIIVQWIFIFNPYLLYIVGPSGVAPTFPFITMVKFIIKINLYAIGF